MRVAVYRIPKEILKQHQNEINKSVYQRETTIDL
jgi:hypothetical protein